MIVCLSSSYRYMELDENTIGGDEQKAIFGKSLYQGRSVRFIPTTYYSSEAVMLLFCVIMSMLILPLILPPLPPPPCLLLLLPIAIFGVLVLLAVAPSNVRGLRNAYV